MAIYKGSRYTNVYTYDEEWRGNEVTAFRIREYSEIDVEDSQKHTWIEGDRLDLLASRYYEDPRHWWFILEANPRYMEENEIQNGDTLLIPPYGELRKIIVDGE
jgi:hypothetical protein